MYNIIFRTNPQFFGLGLCSFTDECPEPVKLVDVNGSITITDGKNKLILNIVNDVISIPILIDDDIVGKTNITIQELKIPATNGFGTGNIGGFGSGFGTGNSTPAKIEEPTKRFYQLSIGKLFRTKFIVINNEFRFMAKEALHEQNHGENNVIEMNISFRTENSLQLISKSPK